MGSGFSTCKGAPLMWPSCPALVMKSGLHPRLCQDRTSRGEHQTCNTRSSPLERRASRGDVPALHACCLLHLLAGPHAPLACTLPFRGICITSHPSPAQNGLSLPAWRCPIAVPIPSKLGSASPDSVWSETLHSRGHFKGGSEWP